MSQFFAIRWPKFWSFSFNISPSNEHSGLISFRMDWLDLFWPSGWIFLAQWEWGMKGILEEGRNVGRSPSNVNLEGREVRFQPGIKSRAWVSAHSPLEAKTPSQSPLEEVATAVGTVLSSEP